MMRAVLLALLVAALLSAALFLGLRSSAEETTDAPLPADEAARTMIVPEGFEVNVFAAEPDVRQPIGFCIDDRGRLWVAEAYNYPLHGTKPGDRILIFEDVDGDGHFDKRTVFYEGLNYVTGIEVGFGGAYVMSPPYLYFIPDRNADDRPDSEPEVLLDGFGNHANSHNLANAFAWGPDGWLYGTHGRTNWSLIGKPGTPEKERIRFDGGVYRYHPIRHEWEAYADGTTNPWGIDWNDYGEPFVSNCVGPHLYHVIQGAHYEPWRARESSRYAYERIESIADHLHFIGTANARDGLGTSAEDDAGGGHAHCGMMVYLGDSFPEHYRNSVFMNNIHGKRINNDSLKRKGSGYVASHTPDLLRSQDPWHVGVTLQYGPDGSVFVLDWSDTGECHHVKNTRRHTGRIFKISYGPSAAKPVDLARLSDQELVELHLHQNDWFVRHARRLLQERMASGHDLADAHRQLHDILANHPEVPRKLRALWTLWATNGIEYEFLEPFLEHEDEYLRIWAIRLLSEDDQPSPAALDRFADLAATDPSPTVRLALASLLQRLDPEKRWPIAKALLTHAEDADDHNLPLMNWYGVEPLIETDLARFVDLAKTCELPLVRRHIARRVASLPKPAEGLALLTILLLTSDDPPHQQDVITGMLTGLEGRRAVPMPSNWPATYASLMKSPSKPVREATVRLALVFDDKQAQRALLALAADAQAAADERNQAIAALVGKRTPGAGQLLLNLISDPAVQSASIRGLAEFDSPQAADALLSAYPTFDATAKQDALQTLSSRTRWATSLLDAVETNRIARSDLTAFTARQLQNLGDKKITERTKALWGSVRKTDAEKARLIARYKSLLTADSLAQADASTGRAIYNKTCANCHTLFDAGGNIGPNITGSQRSSIDYLLENLVDPNAAVSNDYRMQTLVTSAGRVVSGLLVEETDTAITIQTANEKLVIPHDEIEDRATSPVSMMPEGLLQPLSDNQVRDLIAYLMSSQQAPLPVEGNVGN